MIRNKSNFIHFAIYNALSLLAYMYMYYKVR
jgi:hypothetical protein